MTSRSRPILRVYLLAQSGSECSFRLQAAYFWYLGLLEEEDSLFIEVVPELFLPPGLPVLLF